jgi:hypothetical protein
MRCLTGTGSPPILATSHPLVNAAAEKRFDSFFAITGVSDRQLNMPIGFFMEQYSKHALPGGAARAVNGNKSLSATYSHRTRFVFTRTSAY